MEPFDCEMLRDAWPAQPINTISALAFVVVGVWLWRRARRGVATLVVAAGLGSIWFHSDPSNAASWAHDVGLYVLIGVAAIEVWRAMALDRPPKLAAGVLGVGILIWFSSRSGGVLCDPNSVIQGHAAWHILAASAVAILLQPDYKSTHRP